MLDARPTFSACPSCGAALHRDERTSHACDELRLLVRAELATFDAELTAWLTTAHGRFAVWLARREQR